MQTEKDSPFNPKKDYLKFIAGFLAIIFAVFILYIVGFWFWRWYKSWEYRRGLDRLVEEYKKAREEDYRMAMADTYGGKTPYETLGMYIEAVEKGDYELASKYFIGGKQEKWKNELLDIDKSNKIAAFTAPLKEALNSHGEYSQSKDEFSIYDPVAIDFKLYPNGIWKIVEI